MAFNIAANTTRSRPYWERRALRQGMRLDNEMKKRKIEAADLEIDSFDEQMEIRRRDADRADAYLGIAESQEKRAKEKWDEVRDTPDGQAFESSLQTALAAYTNAQATNRPDPGGFAFETMVDRLDQLLPGGREAAIAAAEQNGINPETFDPLKIASFLGITPEEKEQPGYAAKDTYVGEDGREYHAWYDDSGRLHKTGVLAKTESGEDIDFTPPNSLEVETAEKIIENEFDDLDSDYEEIATMWLANEIRTRQERYGESYDVAVAAATAAIKAKITKERDFLSGSDDALDLSGDALAPNEYRGSDGNIYIEAEDGSFRRKD